jgi:hypothetical protein
MRDWVTWLARGRVLELTLALALGTVLASLAQALADVPVTVLAQNVGRNPIAGDDFGFLDPFSAYSLNVSLGRTLIAYGPTLASLIALGLLVLVAAVVVRRRNDELGECPFCASRIPYESTHCAYCGSSVTPAEP